MKPPAWTLALPLLAFVGDALAWGLQTHLFFAQHVLLLAPLADPAFRRAALRFPRRELAGIVARRSACAEDTASRAILFLARAEALLRRSRLPRLCRAVMRRLDHPLSPRLDAYARETTLGPAGIGTLLEGAARTRSPNRCFAQRVPGARSVALAPPPALS